jgi:DNA-binding CsgD family transcriptional regulator
MKYSRSGISCKRGLSMRGQSWGPRPLTDRELTVAELLAQGLSTDSAANRLSLSYHTVAAHLANMLRNLNARNRTELVARLYSRGILASGEWPPRAVHERNLAGTSAPDGSRESQSVSRFAGSGY